MEEAGYPFLNVHQRTHQSFTEHVDELHQRFLKGEDVSTELGTLLQTWLINHIQDDDQGYASIVQEKLGRIEKKDGGGWLSNTLGRLFN